MVQTESKAAPQTATAFCEKCTHWDFPVLRGREIETDKWPLALPRVVFIFDAL